VLQIVCSWTTVPECGAAHILPSPRDEDRPRRVLPARAWPSPGGNHDRGQRHKQASTAPASSRADGPGVAGSTRRACRLQTIGRAEELIAGFGPPVWPAATLRVLADCVPYLWPPLVRHLGTTPRSPRRQVAGTHRPCGAAVSAADVVSGPEHTATENDRRAAPPCHLLVVRQRALGLRELQEAGGSTDGTDWLHSVHKSYLVRVLWHLRSYDQWPQSPVQPGLAHSRVLSGH